MIHYIISDTAYSKERLIMFSVVYKGIFDFERIYDSLAATDISDQRKQHQHDNANQKCAEDMIRYQMNNGPITKHIPQEKRYLQRMKCNNAKFSADKPKNKHYDTGRSGY
jgi:hypothetical protein